MKNYPDGSPFYLYVYLVGAGIHKYKFIDLSECVDSALKEYEADNCYKIKITDFEGDNLLLLFIHPLGATSVFSTDQA